MPLSRIVAALAVLVAACGPGTDVSDRLVDDGAGLLTDVERERIATFHDLLLADFDIDYRVVTTTQGGDIEQFAAVRFADVATGALGESAHGLLLVIDPAVDRVRLEVGYALEGSFTDAFVAYIEQRQMVPFFASGRVADGILATTELIVAHAQDATARAGLDSGIALPGSGGAGASATARIGAGRQVGHPDTQAAAGSSPAATLASYLAAMGRRDGNPALDIYTPESRRMLAEWVMTPAQMDNVVRQYRSCHAAPTQLAPGGRRAVIRYPVRERRCAPWFFERSGGAWQLDLTMMQHAIRFGRDNSWHFEIGAEHPYGFAFEDWTLDDYGYPHVRD